MNRQSPRLKRWIGSAIGTYIARRAKTGDHDPSSVYTGCYAVAHKPGNWEEPTITNSNRNSEWFSPLLADPVTKEPIESIDLTVKNSEGDVYRRVGSILDLRPKHGLSQDANCAWS